MKVPQHRMGSVNKHRSLLLCILAAFCLATITSSVMAQSATEPPKDKPKAEIKAEPKDKAPAPPTPKQPASPPKRGKQKKSGCGGAEDNTPAVLKPAAPGTSPKFVCKSDTVELKPVWKGEPLVFEFTVSNGGDADLNLKIKGGWGTKIGGRSDRVVPPGKDDTIKVTLSSNKGAGPITKRITVTTNDPDKKKVYLTCKGKVLAPFKTKPRIINFGQLKADAKSVTRTMTIERGDGGPLKPDFQPLKNAENVEVNLKEITPGEKYELSVTLTPPWPEKPMRHQLRFKTGVAEAPTMAIPVYARGVPAVVANPNRIHVPHQRTMPFTKTVELVWRDKETPHKIVKATVNAEGIVAAVDEVDGKQTVRVEVPVDFDQGRRRSTQLTIQTDDKKNSRIRVPISFARPPRTNKKPGVSPRKATLGKTSDNAAPANDRNSRIDATKQRPKSPLRKGEQTDRPATKKRKQTGSEKDGSKDDPQKPDKKEKKAKIEKEPTS